MGGSTRVSRTTGNDFYRFLLKTEAKYVSDMYAIIQANKRTFYFSAGVTLLINTAIPTVSMDGEALTCSESSHRFNQAFIE